MVQTSFDCNYVFTRSYLANLSLARTAKNRTRKTTSKNLAKSRNPNTMTHQVSRQESSQVMTILYRQPCLLVREESVFVKTREVALEDYKAAIAIYL